jgi:hypothetical protein
MKMIMMIKLNNLFRIVPILKVSLKANHQLSIN